MDERCCQNSPYTLFERLIRRDRPESTKRATIIRATWTLIACALGIGGCVAFRIAYKGDVGGGAVAAFAATTGPLAVLAGSAYRKRESNETTPGTSDEGGTK